MNHNVKTSSFGRWLRNNIALIVIVSCVLAIVAVVLLATLLPTETAIPVDGEPVDTTPVDSGTTPPDTTIPEEPVVTEPETPAPEVFVSPIVNYTLGMTFTDNVSNLFVFNSTLSRWESHRAVDLIAPTGTEVVSMRSGTVTEVGYSYGLGNYVSIDHGDGVIATYASLDNVTVIAGQSVVGGEKIGETSESANYEFLDGAHLHLAVTLNGTTVDPLPYFTSQE